MSGRGKRSDYPLFTTEKTVALILILLATILAWVIVPETRLNPVHGKAENEYRQFHAKLELGMSRDEVKQTFGGLAAKHLDLRESNGQMWVNTPMRFAKNWQMRLEFKDDKLMRVHSQILDDGTFPRGAPPDKVLTQ